MNVVLTHWPMGRHSATIWWPGALDLVVADVPGARDRYGRPTWYDIVDYGGHHWAMLYLLAQELSATLVRDRIDDTGGCWLEVITEQRAIAARCTQALVRSVDLLSGLDPPIL